MDIFGREAHSYVQFKHMADGGINLEEEFARRAKMAKRGRTAMTRDYKPYDPHALDVAALNPNHDVLNEGNRTVERADLPQTVGYLTDNLMAIDAVKEEILYTGDRMEEFLPMKTNVNPGADTYGVVVMDRWGRGRRISTTGDDSTPTRVSSRIVPHPLHLGGIDVEWSIHELRKAQFGGIPLDTELVEAAVYGAMEHLEIVGLIGEHGSQGLFNLATGTGRNQVVRTPVATTITAMDNDDIVEMLQQEVALMIQQTREVIGRRIQGDLCIYLPIAQATHVNDTKYSDDANETIWSFFEKHNAWMSYTGRMPKLKFALELDGAGSTSGAATTDDRMVVAVKDRRVMEMAIAMTPRPITVNDSDGRIVRVPFEYVYSTLFVKRAAGIRYTDGI